MSWDNRCYWECECGETNNTLSLEDRTQERTESPAGDCLPRTLQRLGSRRGSLCVRCVCVRMTLFVQCMCFVLLSRPKYVLGQFHGNSDDEIFHFKMLNFGLQSYQTSALLFK